MCHAGERKQPIPSAKRGEVAHIRMYDEFAHLWPLVSAAPDYADEARFWRAVLREAGFSPEKCPYPVHADGREAYLLVGVLGRDV